MIETCRRLLHEVYEKQGDRFAATIDDAFGLDFADHLDDVPRRALVLHPGEARDPAELPVGQTRLGGLPDWPDGRDHPLGRDRLHFLMQIDLSDLAAYDIQGLGARGLLSFFWDPRGAEFAVHHHDVPAGELSTLAPPDGRETFTLEPGSDEETREAIRAIRDEVGRGDSVLIVPPPRPIAQLTPILDLPYHGIRGYGLSRLFEHWGIEIDPDYPAGAFDPVEHFDDEGWTLGEHWDRFVYGYRRRLRTALRKQGAPGPVAGGYVSLSGDGGFVERREDWRRLLRAEHAGAAVPLAFMGTNTTALCYARPLDAPDDDFSSVECGVVMG